MATEYNSQTLPIIGSDVYNAENEKPITGVGGQTSTTYPENLTGVSSSAVITSGPVVDKANQNIQTLTQETTKPASDIVNAMKEMAAKGQGKIVSSPEGDRFINQKGDIYDMSGNLVTPAQTTTPDKTQADAVTSALGGTVLKEGEKEIYAPNGVKLIVDKNGNIVQSDGSSLKTDNPYMAGRNIKEFSELSGISGETETEDDGNADLIKRMNDLSTRVDERTKTSIDRIKKMTESAVASQREANRALEGATFMAGIRSGRSRYATELQEQIMHQQVSAGVSKITDLQLKGEQLIAEAEQARDDADFKILDRLMTEYQDNKKRIFDETIRTQELAMNLEKAADEKKKVALETAKLAREESMANAEVFAQQVMEDIADMTPEEQNVYINNTAKESGLFDAATLKTAIDNRQRAIAAEQAKGISSYMADWRALGGQKGTGQTFQQFYAAQQAAERAPTSGGYDIGTPLASNLSVLNAANNIALNLASDKKSAAFMSNINRLMNNGDTNAVKETMINQAILAVPNAADQSKAMGRVVTLDLLDSIKNDLIAYTQKKGNTNVFKGTAEQVKNNIAGMTNDPELAALATKIQATIQNYRQFVSGAAFTDKETKEYINLFPSINKTGELNIANIDGLSSIYRTALNSQLGVIMGNKEYNSIFGQEGAFSGTSGKLPTGDKQTTTFSATAGGKTYYFPDQASLDKFKKDANIQ